MELLKQIAWSTTQPTALHFHTLTGREVDIVLESRSGRVVDIECKASSSVKLDDFKGIQSLKEQAGESFHRGIVIECSLITHSPRMQPQLSSNAFQLHRQAHSRWKGN